MQIEGITWHGVILEPDRFTAMKKLCREAFGLTPMIEEDGWTLFPMPNGTMLDLFEPDSEMIPAYGLNDGIVHRRGFAISGRLRAAAPQLFRAGVGSSVPPRSPNEPIACAPGGTLG
jgi:hypothetical protein